MILNIEELSAVTFSEILEFDQDSVRLSIDGTKTIVKWDGATVPSSVNALTTKEGPYNYNEIITILESSEWYVDN